MEPLSLADFYPDQYKTPQNKSNQSEMSENVQNVHFTADETLRWTEYTLLKDHGQTDKQIAAHWNLTTTKQLQRLKHKAKQNGAYQSWLKEKQNWIHEEFLELHQTIKTKKPELAYSTLAGLLVRSLPDRQEIKTKVEANITEKVDVNLRSNSIKVELARYEALIRETEFHT